MQYNEHTHPYLFEYQHTSDEKTILWTYSNFEKEEGLQFTVNKDWLTHIITNEYGYADEEEFLVDYTFDLSHEIYKKAQADHTSFLVVR